jgi:hypothetical protein
MSKNDADVRLPDRAEELLVGWPAPERDDEAWEQSAQAVMSRLGEAKAELSLLEAPLPQGEEDRKSDPGAPKRSLLELARSVGADDKQRPDADLARESFALANRERTSSPSFHDNMRPSSPSQPVAATATPMPALPANVTRLEKRSNAGPIGMVVVALAGLAAATFIVMQTRNAEQPTAAIVPPTIVVTNAPAAPAATAKTEESEVVALGDLDTAKGASKKGMNQGGATAMAEKPKPGEAAPAKPATKTPDPEEDVKLRPAESSGGTPEKPALGAVQAAVGAVLGSARACVAGQDDASAATIIFGSDGRVQSVAVSGPAQGTNAEPCIKAALSKARVQPFSRPTFAASTAVRP